MYRTVKIIPKAEKTKETLLLTEDSILKPQKDPKGGTLSYNGGTLGYERAFGELAGMGMFLPNISGYVYEVVKDIHGILVLILRKDTNNAV